MPKATKRVPSSGLRFPSAEMTDRCAGDRTQGFKHIRQTLYQLTYICNPIWKLSIQDTVLVNTGYTVSYKGTFLTQVWGECVLSSPGLYLPD